MKKALLTGASGFVGHNIRPFLEEKYEVLAPTRKELDLRCRDSVYQYMKAHPVEVVFHCATPDATRNPAEDSLPRMAEDMIRIHLNLTACREFYGKMIYLGSGAEYDKEKEISNIREEKCFRSLPNDPYGLGKYVIHKLSTTEDNIYNLRLFGCYGPGDDASKFITHCIRKCLRNETVTIRQDCKFDYIHVDDAARMMLWLAEHEPNYRQYNASGCEHMFLSEIARCVIWQMNANVGIELLNTGYNREYTCDGSRFWQESGMRPSVSMEEGIRRQIVWEKAHWHDN